MENREIKILWSIFEKTLLDRERNENIRRACKVDDINDWVIKSEETMQRAHRPNGRWENDEDNKRQGSLGCPRKRWSDNLSNINKNWRGSKP